MPSQEVAYDMVVYEDGMPEQIVEALGIRFLTVIPAYRDEGEPEFWHTGRIGCGEPLPIAFCGNRRGIFN